MHNLVAVQQAEFSVDLHCCCSLPVSLLEADFLRAHSILVDVKGQHLLHPSDFTSITLYWIVAPAPHLDPIASAVDEFAKLMADFPDITTPSFANPTPKHGMSLLMPTNGQPVHTRARQLPPNKLNIAMEKFRKKWRRWASSVVLIASGLHPFSWCPSHQKIGCHVEISVAWMLQQYQITSLYHIHRTSEQI